MRFSIAREALLEPLQAVSSVVERRHTLPILSNLLVKLGDNQLSLTGTDQEVELAATVADVDGDAGRTTVPARKLVEIWRSLPDEALVECVLEGNHFGISAGRFKSRLTTLAAEDFPLAEMESDTVAVRLPASSLRGLLDKCSFAMAQQDVRYFFNGMLMELEAGAMRTVATNGQRLATSLADAEGSVTGARQFIIPRKGVIELARVVPAGDAEIELRFSANHMQASTARARLTTRLIDGTYPDYNRAIPTGGDKVLIGDRQEMREALSRTAILSNEMYRNVRLVASGGQLEIHANNPLQEEAEELVSVDYEGDDLEIGFNVSYLIDALSAMEGEKVEMRFTDAGSAALLVDPADDKSRFVISPMMI